MGEHEHLVKVFPLRLESPVIVSGKRYQIVFVRGKTKTKAPAAITSSESCFVQFESLGCFSQAVIHFKKSSKGFQPKMINFEFQDCSADPQGARIGEAEIDVAALASKTGTCDVEVSHAFRMCGFGATFSVRVVVQRMVNGRPVGEVEGSAQSHSSSISGPPVQNQENFYLPRDYAIGALSKTEEQARRVSVSVRMPGVATTLPGLLELADNVIDTNLKIIPERALLTNTMIEREAARYELQFTDSDPTASEQQISAMLAQSRARLLALRQMEEVYEADAKQKVQALAAGMPTSMEIERDPPLPLLLLARQFSAVQSTKVPVVAPPRVLPILPTMPITLPTALPTMPSQLTAAVAATAASAAKALQHVSIPGTQGMENMFTKGGTDSAVAPRPAAPTQSAQTDLAPTLFESPSTSAPSRKDVYTTNEEDKGGPSMFATPPRAAVEASRQSDGLSAGMFGAKEHQPQSEVQGARKGPAAINFGRSDSSNSNGSFHVDPVPRGNDANYFSSASESPTVPPQNLFAIGGSGSFGAPPTHIGYGAGGGYGGGGGGFGMSADSFEPAANQKNDEATGGHPMGDNPFAAGTTDSNW